MQSGEDNFDVYVGEEALASVHRGEHVSTAQMFGVEWDGPSHSVMYATVFDAPKSRGLAASETLRGSVLRSLLSCILADPAAWVCAGVAFAWFLWAARK